MQKSSHPDHPITGDRVESLRTEIARLANLSDIAFEFDRREVAETFGIRPAALDRLVAAERRSKTDSQQLRGDEPWPEPVNLGELLDEVLALQRRFIAGDSAQLEVVPVWIAQTHLVHQPRIDLQISPRLAVQSVDGNCGKTTLLEFLSYFCPRALVVSSTSAAGIFHIAKEHPTIILDEIDQLQPKSALYHILNASHRRADSRILRADFSSGPGAAKVSDAWCAMAFGGIGQLPGTLQSRCIVVNMRPALAHETLEILERVPAEAADLRRKFARWAADLDKLPQVDLPRGISNRSRDNWRILAQVAHLAGPAWEARIERAALKAAQQERPSATVTLLGSVRRAFAARSQITTQELLFKLLRDEESADLFQFANRGKPITDCWLRERFLGLISNPDRSVKVAGGRGYARTQFAESFQMYLQPIAETNASARSGDQPQAAGSEPRAATSEMTRREAATPTTAEAEKQDSSDPSVISAGVAGETDESQVSPSSDAPAPDRAPADVDPETAVLSTKPARKPSAVKKKKMKPEIKLVEVPPDLLTARIPQQ